MKTALFRRLDEVVTSPDAVLARNTSSIPIARLAAATGRSASVAGLHSFNPVPVLPLVEVIPCLLSAERMVGSGTATPEDIDTGMTAGCAHPMGPLHLVDLIGPDTVAAIGEALYEEHREPLYAPPPLLRRMVESGLLGRKSGRGFFAYPAA
ncbi:3-hydroxyacyl-CoA dehydrogenase family protein [Streptomyces sp. NPDC020299]|uniref:3-hydroxyacyl-CoA dehydrogenase family protein n=1 Tax=Streptomyces sp. NPDC020299 TaxID=3365067 RepID=UPI00378F70B2